MDRCNTCFNDRVLAVLLTFMVCITSRPVHADEPQVRAVRVPNGGVHPRAQTDSRGRVHLIYFKGDPLNGDIFYVRSDDGGASFTPPVRVNSQPDSAIITGTVRGPHLALGRGDRPHVAWMGSGKAEKIIMGGKKAIPMLYTRLNDAGEAFEPQRNVIQNHPGLDGGGSVAADREGNVYVAWHAPETQHAAGGHVSHKNEAPRDEKHGPQKHQRPAGHGRNEEDRQVWIARSRDGGETFEAEVAAIPKKTGVCGCCGLNIVAGDNGRVFIAFRSATATVNRDIHLLASKDFGQTFQIAAVDPWKVGTCMMSTASFAGSRGRLLAAWETQHQVHVARFDPQSPGAVKPTPLPGTDKMRKHPSVAVNGRGEYLVAWAVGTGWNKGGSVAWQAFDAEGQPLPEQAGVEQGLPVWGVPAAVAMPDGTFKLFF